MLGASPREGYHDGETVLLRNLPAAAQGFSTVTLTPYDPALLDQLALRLLDLAGMVRHMAQRSREHGVRQVRLHDKKALEWIARLERWARKSAADLEMEIIEVRATRKAMSRRS